jgi:ParE-like toxin of type II ParDE toxin-antitoxin system
VGWEVVFAPRSEIDLAKIVSHIANDDPAAAIRFGETLINKAESLAHMPGMGPLLPGKGFLTGAIDENTRFAEGDIRGVESRFSRENLPHNLKLVQLVKEWPNGSMRLLPSPRSHG